MSFFKRAKASAAISRVEEEAAYALALREIESGKRRDGLWAKALANSSNAEEAKGKYIKLRVQAYMDERNVVEYVAEQEAVEQAQFESRVTKRLERDRQKTEKEAEEARLREEVLILARENYEYSKKHPIKVKLKDFRDFLVGLTVATIGFLLVTFLLARVLGRNWFFD